jgi:hypothetical protein
VWSRLPVHADPLTVVYARIGYQPGCVALAANMLNILNANDGEIKYFYASRLAGEP